MPNLPTLVIGNGESRQRLELQNLLHKFTTVGCNALHREFTVQHLVCCDRRMVLEAVQNPLNTSTTIYTRSNWASAFAKFKNVVEVPPLPYQGTNRADEPFHWGSGAYAILVATMYSNDIHVVGFDLVSNNGKVNNVYKDTPNYANADSHAVDPNYWIYQIARVFAALPDKYFTIYNNSDWAIPNSWKLENVGFKNIDILSSTL